ncbi:uncharacterized protein LOC135685277 [Rhopilema esculentum]|uniref:uncharacterized protein LOC135685277 n=1 Tax=Rhopilema esculentum TaxID=499914 RepID=UPI0031E241D3
MADHELASFDGSEAVPQIVSPTASSSEIKSHPQKVCQKCGEKYHIATRVCKVCGESIVVQKQYKVPASAKPKKICREKFSLQQKAMNLHYSNGYEVVVLYAKRHKNGALGISTFGTPGVMPFIGTGRFSGRPEGGRLCCQLFERFLRDSQMPESQRNEIDDVAREEIDDVAREEIDDVAREVKDLPLVRRGKKRKNRGSRATKKAKFWKVERVERIRKEANGKLLFFIKWLDWEPSSNSWEPEEHLLPALVQDALACIPVESQ